MMDEEDAMLSKVIAALRDGFGVDDMQAKGIATSEYARRVVDKLRSAGILRRVLFG